MESRIVEPLLPGSGLLDVEVPECVCLAQMEPLKNRVSGRPFRLGTTSYIYPADVLPNVERLAGSVDDIELVFYEVTSLCPLPDAGTLAALRAIGDAHGVSFTVHLPLDLALASGDLRVRESSVELAKRVISAARVLDPWGYILHVEHRGEWLDSWEHWQRLAGASLSQLVQHVGDGALLCLENTEGVPPDVVFALAKRLRTGVCLDIGHLFKAGLDPVLYLDQMLPWTRVVHLHGWDGDRDHRSITVMAVHDLLPVVEWLYRSSYNGVVTLEVFNEQDWLSSLAYLDRAQPEAEAINGTSE